MSIITVKPVERKRWYKNDKADFIIRPIKLQCAVDSKTRTYVLDCSEEERKELQDITGFDLSLEFKTGVQHSFFDDEISHIILNHGLNVFDTEDPLNRIKIAILKGHPMVANSLEEYEQQKNPLFKFIIYNEAEEEKIKASKKTIKRNAVIEMTKLDTQKKLDVYRILTGKDLDKLPTDVLDLKLEEFIEKNPDSFLQVLKKKPANLITEALIIKLLNARILTKEGTIIKYGDVVIGSDMENAVKFFNNDKNQILKLQLQEKLN